MIIAALNYLHQNTGSGIQSVTGTLVDVSDPANPVIDTPSLEEVLNVGRVAVIGQTKIYIASDEYFPGQENIVWEIGNDQLAVSTSIQGQFGFSRKVQLLTGSKYYSNQDFLDAFNDSAYVLFKSTSITEEGVTPSYMSLYYPAPIEGSNINIYLPRPTVTGTYHIALKEDIVDATDLLKGIMKIYSETGSNTDGTMTQKAISDEFSSRNALVINTTTYTSALGVTTEQILSNNVINANSFKANSILNLSSRSRRAVAGNTAAYKFYLSTVSNNISATYATQIGMVNTGLSQSVGLFTREFSIDNNGILTGYPSSVSAASDIVPYGVANDVSMNLVLSDTYYLISTVITSSTGTVQQKTLSLTHLR